MKHLSKGLFLIIVFLFLLSNVSPCQVIQKQNVKVLYVGYDPATPIPDHLKENTRVTGGASPERFAREYGTRMPAFKAFLEQYFSSVRTVDARQYDRKMSAAYDVTIFDEVIEPWKDRVYEKKEAQTIYEPAKYLTEDFDHAAIFIGHVAPTMGESVGSKLDWHCLCLDADAHNIEVSHPIFNRPFKVQLTYANKTTPENYFLFPSGKDLKEEMPMWRVQKEGYKEGQGYRVGLVSRRAGFTDSPDAEYIASGVNTKDAGAVAIGRHGNFFLWGFSGSPDYMTDEAKLVFANAVVYMKEFKGQKPVARKYRPTIAIRDEIIDDMLYRITKEAFQHYLAYEEENKKQIALHVSKLQKKKDEGAELSELEGAILKNNSRPAAVTTWPNYFRSVTSRFFKDEYVENPAALEQFLRENREYMHSDGQYFLEIDEDAKSLGISNRDINLLYKAVALLNKGAQAEKAKRILGRYTQEKFATADEWKQWLDSYKAKLFFTDAGGYLWLVNGGVKSLKIAQH
ncbi:MAG: hypothetical protein ACO1OO_04220 [Flavisolibacter sp.]